MIGQIRHISNYTGDEYPKADWAEFISWATTQKSLQLDIETNVTDWWCTRELVSIQFGSCTEDRRQYFFQWESLTDLQKEDVKWICEHQYIQKLAHNGAYEYIVLRFHGIICENFYDTMLAEKILRGGLEMENYALADISWKYLRIMMDKTHQKSFYRGMLVEADHIRYGITDVAYLDVIRSEQMMEARIKGLLNVFGLEMEALLAFSDITYEGMLLDVEKWRDCERAARPLVKESFDKLNQWLLKEPFYSHAKQKGFISESDRLEINYNSPPQKAELLKLLFPNIIGSSQPIIKKYIRDNAMLVGGEKLEVLLAYQEKNFEPLSNYLVKYHRPYLEERDFLIPAGKVTINWNSGTHQVLPMFQLLEPKLKGLAEEEVNKFTHHKWLKDFKEYGDRNKLITTYGEDFISKHVGPDGRVRTNFNQVVSTGRVSSSSPNMQNIPAKEETVGTRYRNAFICESGCSYVSSDFTGQELAIIAWVSKDPVWLEAIIGGLDLHSICAEMVYGKRWKEGAEKDCGYYHMTVGKDGKLTMAKQKCKCKQHKIMRYDVKTINFGLAYGMSEYKLAGELDITVPEARKLITEYFRAFPLIGRTLEFLGNFGVTNGYIQTLAPFFRKRWFPYWSQFTPWIEAHIKGIKYVPQLGEIERQSKNMPIQGSGADMMKFAMVLVRDYIRDHGLRSKVRLAQQVHDQLDTICVNEFTQEWKTIFDHLMRQAALVIVPNGMLVADTSISQVWTK